MFGKLDGRNYLNFIFERIQNIAYDPVDESNFSYVKFSGGSTLYLTKQFFSDRLSELGQLSSIIHEAKHLHISSIHTYCPSPYLDDYGMVIRGLGGGALAGLAACDYDTDGAYGAEAVFLGNIINNCERGCPVAKKEAVLPYYYDRLSRFPKPPVRRAILDDSGPTPSSH